MSTATHTHHHKLQPGEICTHCDLAAPDYPFCPACARPMDDWPQNPKKFLEDRGWELRDYYWWEPMEYCMGPVTEKMVRSVQDKLDSIQKQLQYKSVKADYQRRGHLKESEQSLLDKLAVYGSGTAQVREQAFYPMQDAIRCELNRTIADKGVVDGERAPKDELAKRLQKDMLKSGSYTIEEAVEFSRPVAKKEQCPYCKRF